MLKLLREVIKMEKYIPDIYVKSIYDINYDNLKERGIKCILFDLDNTLVPTHTKDPSKKLLDFMEKLKDDDFTLIIYSNSGSRRVSNVASKLGLEFYHFVKKPYRGKFDIIIKKYPFSQSEMAIVGDQLLTDMAFGNRVGITTILVNQLSLKDGFFTKFNRIRERKILKKLYKNNLFVKGKYYE